MNAVDISIAPFDAGRDDREVVLATVLALQQQLLWSAAQRPANGFLISAFSLAELAALVDAPSTTLYLASRQALLLGYCLVTARREWDALCSAAGGGVFQGPGDVPSGNWHYLYQIATRADCARRGIAGRLLDVAQREHPEGLLADVLVQPLRNEASLAFFASKGFHAIGELRLDDYRDFGALVSTVLWWRPLPC
jgi:ribosomal protein S18 acetylase RimI-like enzyme